MRKLSARTAWGPNARSARRPLAVSPPSPSSYTASGQHPRCGLREDAFDNATKMVLNQDFTSGLTQPSPLLDHFPYLSPAPES
jgi:hypothetical protein